MHCWMKSPQCLEFNYHLSSLLDEVLTVCRVQLPSLIIVGWSLHSVSSSTTTSHPCWMKSSQCLEFNYHLSSLLDEVLAVSRVRLPSVIIAGWSPRSVSSSATISHRRLTAAYITFAPRTTMSLSTANTIRFVSQHTREEGYTIGHVRPSVRSFSLYCVNRPTDLWSEFLARVSTVIIAGLGLQVTIVCGAVGLTSILDRRQFV